MVNDAHEMYGLPVPKGRGWIFRWFHNGRINAFKDLIEGRESALSVGCGSGMLESELQPLFDSIYGVDMRREMLTEIEDDHIEPLQCVAPPLPFKDEKFDAVIASGIVEHVPDEAEFIRECRRVLSLGGSLYLTIPIELGIGGFLRHLGKNFVHPGHGEYPNGIRRYLDYSLEELFARSPRDKHGTGHRYFNYRYTLKDVKSVFDSTHVVGWPIHHGRNANLFYFVRADVSD